MSNKKMLSSA